MTHKVILAAAGLALTLSSFACSANAQKADQLYGRWEIVTVAGSSPVTAMSGAAAGRLVGQFLVLTPRSVQFASETCRPTYELLKETSAEFFQNYKVDAKTLNLPDPVTRFDADCTDVFVLGPNEIFFCLERLFPKGEESAREMTKAYQNSSTFRRTGPDRLPQKAGRMRKNTPRNEKEL